MIQIHVQVQVGSETPEQSREMKERIAYMDYCRTIFELRQKLLQGQDEAHAEKD